MLSIFRSASVIFRYGPNAWYVQPAMLAGCFHLTPQQNNQPVDSYCAAMPDNIHFTELLKTRHPRSTTLRRIPTEAAFSSDGHDFVRPSELQLIADPADTNRGATSNVPYQLWQHAAYLEADREDPYNIGRILDNIHVRYPVFHYPQYEGQLRSHGIHYLVNASMFDVDFYIARIGMVEGAAHLFSQWVAQELKKVQHTGESQDKRTGIEVGEDKGKENVMP